MKMGNILITNLFALRLFYPFFKIPYPIGIMPIDSLLIAYSEKEKEKKVNLELKS